MVVVTRNRHGPTTDSSSSCHCYRRQQQHIHERCGPSPPLFPPEGLPPGAAVLEPAMATRKRPAGYAGYLAPYHRWALFASRQPPGLSGCGTSALFVASLRWCSNVLGGVRHFFVDRPMEAMERSALFKELRRRAAPPSPFDDMLFLKGRWIARRDILSLLF